MIHILDRQTEQVLDVLVNHSDSKIYWDTKMTESLDDNQLIFEFTTLADSPAAKFIIPKNKITAQDQDGFHRLFSIETVEKAHDENGKTLIVTALGDHTELGTEQPIAPQTLEGQTAETAVQFVLAGTRYVPGQIDFAGSRTITFDSYISPLAALNQIASTFELELRFRVEVHNDGTITRVVDLLKPSSLFDGKEIVFGKDLLGIHRKENTDNICTRLIGVGPADENGNLVTFASVNGGKIYVEDDDAFQRWNNAGRHVWGIFEYQPESSTEVTPQELLDATKKELQNRINSVVEWDVTAAALEQIPGLQHERVRTGMNIRIKDEAFDPAIYLEARVLETEMPELDDPNGNFSYTFGNYHEVTVVVPAEIKAIQKTLFRNANAWTAAKSLAAQALQDAAKAQATADGKITSFYQPDPPETASEGDLWFDTNDGNKPYIWQNGGWQPAQDNGIAEALNRANDAQATADKKVQTFFSDTAPTAEGVGDLWYNPASGTLFRWDGSGWLVVSDVTGMNTAADTAAVNGRPAGTVLVDIQSAQSTANTAQTAANNAQNTANTAQQTANTAQTTATNAQNTANAAQSTINANKSIWDRGSFFNSDGTLDVSKLKGLLSDSQIASASRWNGRTTMITDTGVYTGTILANQIIADSLSGISANLGTVNAGTINGVTINSSEFHSSGANGEISIASDTIMSKYENTSGGFTVLNRAELTSGYLIITNIMDDLNATGTFDGLELVVESHEGNKQHLVRLDPDGLVFSHGDTSYGGVLDFYEIRPYYDSTKQLFISAPNGVLIENGVSTSGDVAAGGKIQSGNVYMNGANSIVNDTDYLYLNGFGGTSNGGATLALGKDGSGARIYSWAIYNRTYSGNANMFITDQGTIGRITSAMRYKEDIQEVDLSNGYAERILQLKPKSWYDKTEISENGGSTVGLDRRYGLIAEDVVAAGLSEYAIFTPPDESGHREVDGIAYDRLWTLLIPVTADHHDRIAWLETENDYLKQYVTYLENLLNELEAKIA